MNHLGSRVIANEYQYKFSVYIFQIFHSNGQKDLTQFTYEPEMVEKHTEEQLSFLLS